LKSPSPTFDEEPEKKHQVVALGRLGWSLLNDNKDR
jgi:hypothetical protein